jgi:hypothetical protein
MPERCETWAACRISARTAAFMSSADAFGAVKATEDGVLFPLGDSYALVSIQRRTS